MASVHYTCGCLPIDCIDSRRPNHRFAEEEGDTQRQTTMWARHDTEAVDGSTALRSSCRLQRTVTAMFMGTPNNTTRTNMCGASRVLVTRGTATLLQYHRPHPLFSTVLRLAVLCVLLLPIGVVSAQSCACDTSVNRGALIDLYDATNGASWTTPWNINIAGSGATVCDWAGVTCDTVTGNVTGLYLAGRGLTGTLPASLAALASLTAFDVSSNALSGTLPDSLGMGWPQLMNFQCEINSIGGTLPVSYSAWSQLTNFDVRINNITGTFPSEYSAWSRLVIFDMYKNNITGTLPASYSAWVQLSIFSLALNRITGTLPQEYPPGRCYRSYWLTVTRSPGRFPDPIVPGRRLRFFLCTATKSLGPFHQNTALGRGS